MRLARLCRRRVGYPLAYDQGGGDEGVLDDICVAGPSVDDHRTIRDALSLVDGRNLADPVVFNTLARCMAIVMEHMSEEEERLFPLLDESGSVGRLAELAARMESPLTVAPAPPQL